MKELLDKWEEYKKTDEYKKAVTNQQAAELGMGFMNRVTNQPNTIFESFMEWLSNQT